jgi:hypothetical protein
MLLDGQYERAISTFETLPFEEATPTSGEGGRLSSSFSEF